MNSKTFWWRRRRQHCSSAATDGDRGQGAGDYQGAGGRGGRVKMKTMARFTRRRCSSSVLTTATAEANGEIIANVSGV